LSSGNVFNFLAFSLCRLHRFCGRLGFSYTETGGTPIEFEVLHESAIAGNVGLTLKFTGTFEKGRTNGDIVDSLLR
jgi:hypothetical protein